MIRLRLVTTLSLLFAQSYPPAFPRPGAVALLDNDAVQVWNVAWPKGQSTPLHRHVYDMTGQYYAPGDRLITAVDGSKRPVTTKAGGIVWQLKGVTHVEAGTSDEPLRAVMIELKKDAYGAAADRSGAATFPQAKTTPLLDNERVTVSDYTAPPAARHHHVHDTVIVWVDGSTPHAIFVPRGTVHDTDQTGTTTRATVFELK